MWATSPLFMSVQRTCHHGNNSQSLFISTPSPPIRTGLFWWAGLAKAVHYHQSFPNRRSSTKHSDKLWASIDGLTWDSSLHTPLPTRRTFPAAFNIGIPEYLVVVGGLETPQNKKVDKVEVLIGEQWVSLSPLTCTSYMLRPLVHNGNVIFCSETCPSFYCKLAELKAECELAYKDKYTTPTSLIVWNELLSKLGGYCFLSYKHQLLHFTHRNGGKYVEKRTYVIKIHSPATNDWRRIADLPADWCPRAVLVGPTGEIVMVVEDLSSSPVTSRILTGSVRGKEGREVVAHHCILKGRNEPVAIVWEWFIRAVHVPYSSLFSTTKTFAF